MRNSGFVKNTAFMILRPKEFTADTAELGAKRRLETDSPRRTV